MEQRERQKKDPRNIFSPFLNPKEIKNRQKFFIRSCLFGLLLSTSGFGEEPLTPSPSSCPLAHGDRVGIRHLEPKGIGFQDGYTSLDIFLLDVIREKWIPLIDTRVHVFNQGKPAFNLGLGFRFVASEYIFGLQAYYDYRRSSHARYNQAAFSLEALGDTLDFRVSGYLPFGTRKSAPYHITASLYGAEGRVSAIQEFSMPGVSGEVGGTIECTSYATLYLAAGPYYFSRFGQHASGGEVRGNLLLFKHLSLDVEGSYDPVFHGIVQGQIGLTFPFGTKPKVRQDLRRKSCRLKRRFQERALQPITRQEMIVLSTRPFSFD